jgi:succinate dehydrogenase / fumarate reductase, cytochrome b subunit
MTVAQAVFLVGLSIVVVAIVAFTAVVLAAARRSDGGGRINMLLIRRMITSPRERAELNRWAFYLHRISGIAITGFLALHIVDVSLYSFSHHLYDNVHSLYANPALRLFECGLIFAVLFHTVNGLRLLAVDLADIGIAASTKILGAVVVSTVALGVVATWFVMRPVFS